MERVAEWVARRRKILGFERQKDLEQHSAISLSTIQEIESKGDLLKRERATRRLLAYALRVSEEDMLEFAKGNISEDQIREEGRDAIVDWLRRLNDVGDQARLELVGSLSRQSLSRLAKMIVNKLAGSTDVPKEAATEIRNSRELNGAETSLAEKRASVHGKKPK